MKIDVLGWYFKNNIGDESYKFTFPLLFPGHEFNFFDELKTSATTVILGGGNILNKEFVDIFNNPIIHVVTTNWDDAAYMCRCYKRLDDPSETVYLYNSLAGYKG